MINILHFDTFSGISGDMTLGALLDLVRDDEWFLNELKKIGLDDYSINITEKSVKGISTLKVNIEIKEQKKHRHLSHIVDIINKSVLSENVKKMAISIFTNLAIAEASVHNTTFEKVHFHEVGAVDAIIDIVGTSILINRLAPDLISCSSLPLGRGFVNCDHGIIPVPAPATVELLKGIPVYDSGTEGELVTPTGAAIIKTLCTEFVDIPTMTLEKVGYGSGTIEREIPNILRVFFGKKAKKKRFYILESNIDDINSEYIPDIIEKIMFSGALDVWVQPVLMKKARYGYIFSALTSLENLTSVEKAIFKETPTIGIRKREIERDELHRENIEYTFSLGTVNVKKAYFNSEMVNIKPEHDDIIKISEEKTMSIKDVLSAFYSEFK